MDAHGRERDIGSRREQRRRLQGAYAAAEAANNEAGKLRNQWTTAVSALKDAKAAAAAGDFDKAVAESRKSETLSKAAIFQSNEQKDAWRKMEIR